MPASAPILPDILVPVVDPAEIDSLINDPVARAHLGGDGHSHLDIAAAFADGAAGPGLALSGHGAAALLVRVEGHPYIREAYPLRSTSDPQSMAAFRDALLSYAFMATDALEVIIRVPADSPAFDLVDTKLGWRHEADAPYGWPGADSLVDCKVWSCRMLDWMKQFDGAEQAGLWLERWLPRVGLADAGREPDLVRRYYLGLASGLIFSGQPEKAVMIWNRGAMLLGYGQIALLGFSPFMFGAAGRRFTITNEGVAEVVLS